MSSPRTSLPTVLVTGVGAIIGQGIIRSLRASRHRVRIVGLDRSRRSNGPALCDTFVEKPVCGEDHPEYLAFWQRLLREHAVDIVLPGLEVDVDFLDRHRGELKDAGCVLALNSPPLIALASDKWALGETLRGAGLPHVPSMLPGTWEEATRVLGKPPFLLKPRKGNGSRGVTRLEDRTDFDYWLAKSNGHVLVQRYIGSDADEYTVGVFGTGDSASVGAIVFRRRLSAAGNTVEATVVDDPEVSQAVSRLNALLRPLGPTNYQFRKDGAAACLLDVNPRFSSSNSLRTAFGYNEAEMALDFYLFGQLPSAPDIRRGTAWRYTEDFVVHDRDPL